MVYFMPSSSRTTSASWVHHVDDDIGRQAVGAVGEPLDEVSVGKARDPHGAALIVDLGVVGQDLKLRHHIRQLTQLPAAQARAAESLSSMGIWS